MHQQIKATAIGIQFQIGILKLEADTHNHREMNSKGPAVWVLTFEAAICTFNVDLSSPPSQSVSRFTYIDSMFIFDWFWCSLRSFGLFPYFCVGSYFSLISGVVACNLWEREIKENLLLSPRVIYEDLSDWNEDKEESGGRGEACKYCSWWSFSSGLGERRKIVLVHVPCRWSGRNYWHIDDIQIQNQNQASQEKEKPIFRFFI